MQKICSVVRTSVIIAFAFVAFSTLTACGSIQETLAQTSALRDQAKVARTEIATQVNTLESAQSVLPPNAPESASTSAALAAARAKLASLDAAILHADQVIAEITAPTDSITQGIGALAPFLPPPAQGPALLGAALLATIIRARQVRKGAGSIATSISKAMQDPEFKSVFERHSDTIRSIQTPAARRIVDQETGKAGSLRSPI